NGSQTAFRGCLAELAFHSGKLVTLKEHRDQYVAFGMPYVAGSPSPGAKLNYTRDSTLCTVVADDATTGDRVACYAGGGGLPDQVALARNDAASATGNPDKLGLASWGEGLNVAYPSEAIDRWILALASVSPDAVASPRGDQTAHAATIPMGAQLFTFTTVLRANGPMVFSIWMRGRNDGDYTYMRLSDESQKEQAHCLTTLTKKWKRYTCPTVFSVNTGSVYVAVDGFNVNAPKTPMQSVVVELWGAQ